MARRESPREDLLAEATALTQRAEYRVPGEANTVVAGFRADGSLAIYFGDDPFYQFDPQGRLRRAFRAGRLYRTQGTTLAQLTRSRTESQTRLDRCDLGLLQLREFLNDMRQRLDGLLEALRQGHFQLLQQVPDDDALTEKLLDVLADISKDSDNLAPAIKSKP